MTGPTSYQIGLLQHMLGISEWHRDPHRNHFVAGPGHHDQKHLEQLEVAGLVERGRTPGFLPANDVVFRVTDTGRALAIASLPEPKRRTRYEEYLDADGCAGDSFGEFLCGGRMPQLESRSAYGRASRDRLGNEYRMYRYQAYPYDYRRDVEGDWAPTRKAAKASYKAALKKHQESQRADRRAYA